MTDYIDGEISKELKEEVEKHLTICEDCWQLKQDLQGISGDLFEKVKQIKVTDLVWVRIKESVTKKRKQLNSVLGNLMNYLRPDFFIKKPVFSMALMGTIIFLAVIFTKISFNNQKVVNAYLKEQVDFFVYLDTREEDFLTADSMEFGTSIEKYFF